MSVNQDLISFKFQSVKVVATFALTGETASSLLTSYQASAQADVESDIDVFLGLPLTSTQRILRNIQIQETAPDVWEVYPKYFIEGETTLPQVTVNNRNNAMINSIKASLRLWIIGLGVLAPSITWYVQLADRGSSKTTGDE